MTANDFEREVLRFIGSAEERLDQIQGDLAACRVDIAACPSKAECDRRHASRLKLPTTIQGWIAVIAAILALLGAFRVEIKSREALAQATDLITQSVKIEQVDINDATQTVDSEPR